MATLRDQNGLNERRIRARLEPLIYTLLDNAVLGSNFFIRVNITDATTVLVEDGDLNYDTTGYAAICDGLSVSTADTGVVVTKAADGKITTTT